MHKTALYYSKIQELFIYDPLFALERQIFY